MELERLKRVKRPTGGPRLLGTLFLSFASDKLGSERKLLAVTSGKPSKFARWRVKVHTKPVPHEKEIRKIELYQPDVSIEEVMSGVVSFYGSKRRLVAAQLTIGGIRRSWINPELLENEDFKQLAPGWIFNEIEHFKKGFAVWI